MTRMPPLLLPVAIAGMSSAMLIALDLWLGLAFGTLVTLGTWLAMREA
jgi:hypothetical protein